MSPIITPTHHLIPQSPPITSPPWHVQRLVGILGRRRSYTTLHDLWYLVCHTCDSVTYPIRDVGQVTLPINNFTIIVTYGHLAFHFSLTYTLVCGVHSTLLRGVCLCHANNLIKVHTNTLGISTLETISLYISNHKTIISILPTCCTKCHDATDFSLAKSPLC